MPELSIRSRRSILRSSLPSSTPTVRLLILAGAGSGKTRVITYRIVHLVTQGHARPDEVLAVTFTNKAAEEMRTRVEQLVGDDCRQIWLSTFHAMSARLLRREAPAIGLSRDFVIYDSSDQMAVVRQAMKALDIDDKSVQPRAALGRISQAKNRMESPESMRGTGWSLRDQQIAKIYEAYLRTLHDAGALDFDDLLLKTVELFETNERVRDQYARKFKYVMVDEYQDTNRPQYMLIRRLSALHRNLCVVGDPDQSIYRWRGADLRNILDFERDYPDATIVKLEQNYRSTQIILDAASAVISQNRNRKHKRLWTDQKGGERVLYVRAGDEIEEADYITRLLREAGTGRGGDRTSAVLYRTNAQSRAIEDALMREGVAVPHHRRRPVLRAQGNQGRARLPSPADQPARRRQFPARGERAGARHRQERARGARVRRRDRATITPTRRCSPPAWTRRRRRGRCGHGWSSLSTGAPLQPRALDAAQSVSATSSPRSPKTLPARAFPPTLSRVLDRSGYLKDLRDERSEEAEARVENLMELVSAAGEYESRESEPTLGGFVDRLSLLSEADEAERHAKRPASG